MIPWRVTHVKVLPDFRLEVSFADGLSGIVDMSSEAFDGVFAPMADPAFFTQARVEDGVVVWPNGVDIAPDALYDEVAAQHEGRGPSERAKR
jgi:hypothetical protein